MEGHYIYCYDVGDLSCDDSTASPMVTVAISDGRVLNTVNTSSFDLRCHHDSGVAIQVILLEFCASM